jgi:hypothetical protein
MRATIRKTTITTTAPTTPPTLVPVMEPISQMSPVTAAIAMVSAISAKQPARRMKP